MKSLIALVLRIAAILGLYGKGRIDARKNQKIHNLEAEVKANEIEDEVSDMGADARRDELAGWVRDRK